MTGDAPPVSGSIRVGTCSWAEKSLIDCGEFYPPGIRSAEERLRFYASRFTTVEVDATYYAIPARRIVELWAERSPPGFIFHVKVYGALTGHGIDPRTLPPHLRELFPPADREHRRLVIDEPLLLGIIAESFAAALKPLRDAGKLGLLVFQFPPWFVCNRANFVRMGEDLERLGPLPAAVEFRHGSWLLPDRRDRLFGVLRERGITYVTADEPQFGSLVTIPFIPEATTGTAYLRLHGRNRESWLRKGVATPLRYSYLYSDAELAEFREAADTLHRRAATVFVMFNNCHGGFAVRNARRFLELLAG